MPPMRICSSAVRWFLARRRIGWNAKTSMAAESAAPTTTEIRQTVTSPRPTLDTIWEATNAENMKIPPWAKLRMSIVPQEMLIPRQKSR